MKKGYFISFEGGDGSGKSTQIRRLKSFFEKNGYQVILTREPGGTDIGEKIRQIILDPENERMTGITETMLYAASRAQHVHEVIKPAVSEGKVVICDRFVDSSFAYQGYARGLGESVSVINEYAIAGCMPDMTFLMKLKPDVGSNRIKNREKDRIELETEDFHMAVYKGYEELEKACPGRIVSIDAAETVEEIEKKIAAHAAQLFARDKQDGKKAATEDAVQ